MAERLTCSTCGHVKCPRCADKDIGPKTYNNCCQCELYYVWYKWMPEKGGFEYEP
ncbi:hypothetical protein LCGC14_1675060 [marine sediment metagenome]|uniref:Uncharacterized protein n=1 Tax=marine sediment metagenome TaxID=412755 RepID=A0A0F9KQ45_9ZZZZ